MLAVNALTRVFGGFTAVNSVSFEVKEGEILGLIGPNGSGKSTTFNLIAGALAPTAGSIRFLGQEIGGWPAYRVAHAGIGRTFQIPRPFRRLSIIENVAIAACYGQAVRPTRDQVFSQAEEILDLVRLRARRHLQSGRGHLQRVEDSLSVESVEGLPAHPLDSALSAYDQVLAAETTSKVKAGLLPPLVGHAQLGRSRVPGDRVADGQAHLVGGRQPADQGYRTPRSRKGYTSTSVRKLLSRQRQAKRRGTRETRK
jgi:ABC-type Fe3+/spermidine/putrescine transport system ATPase subunit